MTVTQVQKTGQLAGTTTTAASGVWSPSTAGTLLTAKLTSSADATAFTQHSGTSGWTQRRTVQNAGVCRIELWTYENNPGGLGAPQWDSATGAQVNAEIAEYSSSLGTLTLDQTAVATQPSGNTTIAPSATGVAAGALAEVMFADRFGSSPAGSWTLPSGWHALATQGGTILPCSSYYQIGVAGGTLSVTGTFSTSAGSTGLAALLATFKEPAAGGGGTGGVPAAGTLVQRGSQSPGTGGTAVLTLPAPSTKGTTLFAKVISAAGGTTFTPPSGSWVLDVAVALSTTVRAEIWRLANNPGNISSASFTSGTGLVNGQLSEWSPGPNGVFVLDQSGSATLAGPVSQLPVSTSAGVAAGDIAECCFGAAYSATNAGNTWTTPTGWSNLGQLSNVASLLAFDAASQSSTAAGTLSATGKLAVSTGNTGWAGVVAAYTAVTQGAPGGAGLAGDNCPPQIYDTVSSDQQTAIANFQAITGRPFVCLRQYYGAGKIPASLAASGMAFVVGAGIKLCVSFKPATDGSEVAALDACLASFRAGGLTPATCEVALWHEPVDNMSAATFKSMWGTYAPVVRKYFPVVYCTSVYQDLFKGGTAYYPGSALVDKIAADYYCSGYVGGQRLATSAGVDPTKPFGLWEFGVSETGQTQAQGTAFWAYIQNFFAARLTQGLTNADVIHFTGNPNDMAFSWPPFAAGDYQIALFDKLYDTVGTGPGTGGSPGSPSITTTSLAGAQVAVPYSDGLAAVGGTLPYAWSIQTGSLPAGLSLDASSGAITGTPTATGTSTATFKVTGALGQTATATLTITVAAQPLTVTTTTLAAAAAGSAYPPQTLTAAGGTAPYTWGLDTGSLPAGLALSSAGVISGTPARAGTSTFTVKATDSVGATATAVLSITVSGDAGRGVSAGFLAAVTGSHGMAVRATVLTTFQTGTTPTGTVIPVIDGDVQLDGTAQVRATLDLTTDGNGWDPRAGNSALQPYGNEVYVERGIAVAGSVEWVGLGYFKIGAAEQDAPNQPVRISGSDRMQSIIDARLPTPVTFGASASVADVFTTLVRGVYPAAKFDFDWHASADLLGGSATTSDDRYGFLSDLATSRGKIMYFDYRGILAVKDPPGVAVPVWTVAGGPGGVLVSAARTIDRDGVYNAIVATTEGASTTSPAYALAYDASPDSPTYWNGPFGKVPAFYTSPLLTTVSQAMSAAASILKKTIGLPHAIDFTAVPNPAMQPWDPVAVGYGPYASAETHVIMTLTIPLTAAAPLQGTTREQGGVIVNVEGLS